MTVDYSIVICTYNPDVRLLERCLNAVASLKHHGLTSEVIVVDNNSTKAIEEYKLIVELGSQLSNFRVVREEKQGLLFARIHGIEQSTGRFIVFFDDDNEPFDDYLLRLHELTVAYPNVAAWGPGNVWVDFIDGIDEALRKDALPLFQERHEQHIAYACIRALLPCYPYGTGMAISRLCAQEYLKRASSNEFSFTGRQGQRLSSGDDTQMVLCCIAAGYAAGISPALKINHIIPAKRASYAYMKKLTWGTLSAHDPSIKQVFPEYLVNFGKPLKASSKTNFKIIRKYLKTVLVGNPTQTLKFIHDIGLLSSSYTAFGKPQPWAIAWALKRLGVN